MKRLHRTSGMLLAFFILLHISNHLFAVGGPVLHITVMNLFRNVYRFPPVEIILLACVLYQLISGIVLAIKKGFKQQPLYTKVQVFSGLYLSLFLINHVMAVMLARYQWNIETDFYFAAGPANTFPGKLLYIPYYTFSLLSVFAHIATAHYARRTMMIELSAANAGQLIISTARYKKEVVLISIAGGIITLLIMLSFTGVLYTIPQ